MKSFKMLLACLCLAAPAWAQDFDQPSRPSDHETAPSIIETGRQVFIRGHHLGDIGKGDALAVLEMLTLGAAESGSEALVATRSKTDELGMEHTRVQQYVHGLPVVGSEMIVHVDKAGEIVGVNGMFANTDTLPVKPRLKATLALRRGMMMANIKGARIDSQPELTYVMNASGEAFLAWSAMVNYENEEGPQRDRLFADASGRLAPVRHPQYHYVKNRRTYHGNYGSSLPGSLSRSEGQGNVGDAAIDAAHNNAGLTYDYYQAKFNRDSYNNAGATLSSTAHHQQSYNNAFWNGSQMVYGDGDGQTFSYLSGSLDVVAHELTHAVTGAESGLIYQNESGALNEALSDIFGVSATVYASGSINSNTWLLGEEVYTPNTPGDALRYMNDPARGGDKDYYPDRYTGSQDNGGVHTNSGIANLAFYLMVQGGTHPRGKTSVSVPAIGLAKAEQIFYRAQVAYLGPNSNFEACRNATASAAGDLYGQTEVDAVHKAWDAVGVPGGGGGGGGGGTCSGNTYSGYLNGTGSVQYQPNGSYYYAGAGSHVAVLDGQGPDFDLYLWKWNGQWVTVAQSESPTSNESINYNGSAGYYVWRVYSYSGGGGYDLCIDTP